jgi:hypothetical protein
LSIVFDLERTNQLSLLPDNEEPFYPAVINYKNTQEANQQIPQVPQEMKNKAKAVNINQWCPRRELKPVEDPKIYDYIECK